MRGEQLRHAVPEAQLVDVADQASGGSASWLDVLTRWGGTVDAALMDATHPRLIQRSGAPATLLLAELYPHVPTEPAQLPYSTPGW